MKVKFAIRIPFFITQSAIPVKYFGSIRLNDSMFDDGYQVIHTKSYKSQKTARNAVMRILEKLNITDYEEITK